MIYIYSQTQFRMMNHLFSQPSDLSLKQVGTNKKIKKMKSKAKAQNGQNNQKVSTSTKDEVKYLLELTSSKKVDKNQLTELPSLTKTSSYLMGHLESDIFNNSYKIISLQQQKQEIIVKCLPFKETNLLDIKKDFPFYINLDQVSMNIYSCDTQRTLECVQQKDVPLEKFEFIINPNQDIIGCNRIVNNSWLKMFGINQDMMIHNLLKNQSFPSGWGFENQIIQNQVSNTFFNKKLRVQLVCYNSTKFHADIHVRQEIETNSKNQFLQRYQIQYFINRENLSLSQVEQNFQIYFQLKDLTQELMDKFIVQTNKQCQIKKL
ncbi:unnamed protein product (macronuclear) [Paramecium tetraurelia]|uniref:Uncharacterized protein n=1 Tax=Paramecium tetraurelia TaxID=5888 RepID=A0BPB8_PARTE|nr:uncharacterized protein GSPATT00005134001 [Paramecium tetraurelia]CAK60385.1 unnamed protein product [Paramecium tetraurelia]|eukprot:XP_001427783.1 hypothetical protein (macronuclear) [Paramecium tetraurelia strain d4-2]